MAKRKIITPGPLHHFVKFFLHVSGQVIGACDVAERRTERVSGGKQCKIGRILLWGRMRLVANEKTREEYGAGRAKRWQAQG